jgi:phage tail tape-measure protein
MSISGIHFNFAETAMKTRMLLIATLSTLALSSGAASAKGCIQGAAVGGVAGHVAGHHGVAGAAIGCAVGHHRAKVKARNEAAQANAAPNDRSSRVTPNENTEAVRR